MALQDMTKIPELRKRMLFTLGMLLIYRLGVFIPTPGIDYEMLTRQLNQAAKTLFGMINMFSGGALENFSIFALGIMPYISVSIIIQLLATTVKAIEELQKEGDQGRRILTRYTRLGTIVLALFQGTMISMALEQQGVVAEPGWAFRITTAITLTAGTAFIMWLGEQITERGIGNGISIIIMAGIVARMPLTLIETFRLSTTGAIRPITPVILIAFGIATVAFIVFVETSQRRIPVQYPRRAMGKRMTQASTQHLPLKVNSAGVIPPIFASALLSFMLMFAQFADVEWLPEVGPASLAYELVFALLIVFFCYFYTAIVFDPNKVAENLKKSGGFIPQVRPGRDTADYLTSVLTRLTLWGALYVCAICIIPSLFYSNMNAASFATFFGGTAVLIVVGVTLDTASQIESHLRARDYEGFMNRGSGKVRGLNRATQVRGRLIQR